jgi:hypothetical protein
MSVGKPKTVFVLVRSDWVFHDGPWSGDYAFLRGYATREEAEAAVPGRPLDRTFGIVEQSYQIIEVPVEG